MITIITTKRWKQMQADNRQMRETIARYDEVMRNLIRRIDRMEKELDEAEKENRTMKADIKKIQKQNT